MGSSDNSRPSSLSLDDAPSKQSFFSRLASPLRSRTRNLADYHIRLKEPHRQYVAGDHVRGHVVVHVIKPFRVTHLTVALHGHVRAFKNSSAAAQLSSIDPAALSGDGTRNYKYHGNGHASLFKDEQVLCGDGRLKPAKYEFEFDLIFPERGLFSSIDFERGSISYIVTATLTRPTSIAPTTTCETKVSYVEQIDVGPVPPPPERRVVMQTMRRKPRRRKTAISTTAPAVKISPVVLESAEAASDRDSTRVNENSQHNSTIEEPATTAQVAGSLHRSPMHSDIQSEFSGESAVSNNSSGRGPEASGESNAGSKASNTDYREITATIEVLKGGCVAGDAVPVRIKVNHTRRLKSMHGVIVTLYRQGRVDYAPPIHMFADLSKEDAERLQRDEYYPRSKTGLGGLSLSSAGSCSVFRKDLFQTVSPLIIDPVTLTATINTSIRVPDDAFPSIKGLPGGLISFRYYVEVVVDLGGKLAGAVSGTSPQTSRLGTVGLHAGAAASSLNSYDNKNIASWTGSIVDTDHLRREKGVISVNLELTIGTTDSSRSKNKAPVRPVQVIQPPPTEEVYDEREDEGYGWHEDHDPSMGQGHGYEKSFQQPPQDYDMAYESAQAAAQPYAPGPTSLQTSYHDFEPRTPVYVPRAEIPNQGEMSEKDLVRQAEQRLLPSQPGIAPAESEAGPSQPTASREVQLAIRTAAIPPSQFGATVMESADNAGEGPSAPSFADISAAASADTRDDKQELERRRLMEEASAPPEVPEEYVTAGPSAPPMTLSMPGPSAPPPRMLSGEHEDHDHDNQNHYGSRDPLHAIAGPSAPQGSEPLPRYER